MADERKPSSLRNLLENVYEVHRKDIKTYASGHLNPSKLLKPPDGHHAKWETSDKLPVRLKPPSKLVDLPVRKGELTRRERRQKNMADCLMEFSLGPMKNLVSQSEFSGESTKKSSKEESKTTTDNLASDKIHVEELHLPEIMIPLTKRKGSNGKYHPEDVRHAFLETYLSHPTKAEQFSSFKSFGDDVMNIGDAYDKGVLTGERTVRKLEHKLAKQLAALEAASQKGPNFHRLQIYNNCLDEIISESRTFGPLLKRIKEEYDSYMSHLLDSQKPSQHRVLYHHIDSLSENPSTSDKLKAEQKRVELLEREAKMLLDENASLKQTLTEEELRSADETQFTAPAEPQSKLSAVHVEEVPKDLEEQVEELHAQILAHLDSIDEIKRYQKEYCVPITVCQHLEQCIKETEVDIQKLLKQNEFLEQTIQELEHELELLLERTETKEKDSRKLWKQINLGAVLYKGQNGR